MTGQIIRWKDENDFDGRTFEWNHLVLAGGPNNQHPGETPSDRSDPANPSQYSNWPDYACNGRPRSALVVIRKIDGGIVGS